MVGTRLNYLFTVGGNEWGCSVVYNSQYEEGRTPWFQWGVTDWWEPDPKDSYWRGDYVYMYDASWNLEMIFSGRIGGYKDFKNAYVLVYDNDPLPDEFPWCTGTYRDALPNVYPLVQGATKIDSGRICSMIPGGGGGIAGYPEGRGTYERRVYVEDFEEIEAGGETYRCAKVRYFMRHTLEFLSPYYNEDWGKIEWVEEGYHWYTEFGLVKADVTIKTYWWDELEETDTILIELTGAILP
jgi:hypothetical protein